MKKLLILFLLTGGVAQAQVSATFDRIFRQNGGKGLSEKSYSAADSASVRVTLPAAVTTAAVALTTAQANATGVSSLTTNQIIVRMRAALKRAQLSNPLINPVYSGPASLSITSTEPTTGVWAGTVTKAQFTSFTALPDQAPLRFIGGTPEWVSGGTYVRVRAVAFGATGQTPTQVTPGFEVMTDSPNIAFSTYSAFTSAQQFRILINDQPVSLAVPGSLTLTYVNATNHLAISGLTGISKIRFETGQYPILGYIKVPSPYTYWKPDAEERVKVAWVGDSYSSTGHSQQFTHNNIAALTGYLMGWDVTCVAIGGTGYVNNNSGNNTTYGDPNRIIQIDPTSDVAVLWGSVNDTGSPTLQTNALAAFQAVRAKLPSAPIIVFGVPANVNQSVSFGVTKEGYLKAAFDQWGDANSVFIPISTATNGPWISDAAADMYTNVDIVHPTTTTEPPALMPGAVYFAYRNAQALKVWLNKFK